VAIPVWQGMVEVMAGGKTEVVKLTTGIKLMLLKEKLFIT
jgi:hypothetical protein